MHKTYLHDSNGVSGHEGDKQGLHTSQLFLIALTHSKHQTVDGSIAMEIFIGAVVNSRLTVTGERCTSSPLLLFVCVMCHQSSGGL